MKKTIIYLLTAFLINQLNAQFNSFKTYSFAKAEKEPIRKISYGDNGLDTVLTGDNVMKKIDSEIDSVLKLYHQKRLFVLTQNSITDKKKEITALLKERDSIVAEKESQRRKVKYFETQDAVDEIHYEEDGSAWHKRRNFLPAFYSSQAVRFFEGDDTHTKLFQNNLINYNPKTKKMTLFTEAVNDYIGPLRVGIGFQIESESKVDSLSTVDSTKKLEKKTDMLAAIQNGGGDIAVNVKLPFLKSANPEQLLQYRLMLYGNTGFSLPVLNKASDDFIFNYDLGMEGSVYAAGLNGRLTFYGQFKAAYFNGNSNYRKTITDANKNDPSSFGMIQSSFGLDFLDGYRLRVDLFHGNSFVKKNFPATVTFIVRPGKKKEEEK